MRMQEVFGLAATPRIGGGHVPITFKLLSPAHRPLQVTRDLASFWKQRLRRGAQGHARPLSAPLLARESARGRADAAREAAPAPVGRAALRRGRQRVPARHAICRSQGPSTHGEKPMGRHHRLCLLLLAACAAARVRATARALAPRRRSRAPQPASPPTSATRSSSLEVQVRLSQQLDVSNLSALVRFGVVTLDGKVRSEADRQRAEAARTRGPRRRGHRQRAHRRSSRSSWHSPTKPTPSRIARARASRSPSPHSLRLGPHARLARHPRRGRRAHQYGDSDGNRQHARRSGRTPAGSQRARFRRGRCAIRSRCGSGSRASASAPCAPARPAA